MTALSGVNRDCIDCGKPFEKDHVAENSVPPEPGRWRHSDCNDPMLSKDSDLT